MKIEMTNSFLEKFPDTTIGVVIARRINNNGSDQEILGLLKSAESGLSEKIGDTSVSEHAHIAPWRDAYRSFGAKPKKYPSSIENLVRRVSKGESVRHINKLVDIYNYISLKYILPIGGEDLKSIDGDLLLAIASENEVPVKLLGETNERSPYADEVIYKDDTGTICRRWNWKGADRTKLTKDTTDAVFIIEAIPPIKSQLIEAAVGDLSELIQKFCGGSTSVYLLNNQNSSIEFEI